MNSIENELADVLKLIELHDVDYPERYKLVFRAVPLALAAGFAAGIRIDEHDLAWPVVYIELPTGQVSWHIPQHPVEWDGHNTAEKYRRTRAFTQAST